MPSLIWHIVKKDFRSLRVYLTVWWGILVCGALVTGWQVQWILQGRFRDNFPQNESSMENWFRFFQVLDVVMLALVVDAIVKGDSPIDEKAFWRTRPIGHGRMFAAKLASFGLLCFFVPGIIYLAGHLVFGFNAGEFLRLLDQFVVIQGPFVAVVACAAVLFSRTLQGLLYLPIIFFGGIITNLVMLAFPDGSVSKNSYFYLSAALDIGWNNYSWMLFATVVVVAALMYAGQGRRAGILALLCGFLMNWAVGIYFIPQVVARQDYANGNWAYMNPARNDSVKLSVEPSSVVDQADSNSLWRIYGWINNPSFPELKNSVWRIAGMSSALSWNSSPHTVYPSYIVGLGTQPAQLINAPAAIAAAGYGRLAWPTVGTWRDFPLALLDNAQLAHIKTEPADLTAKVYVESGHLQRVADLPAEVGATWHEGMTKSCVNTVTVENPTTVLIETNIVGPWYLNDRSLSKGVDAAFLLFNPKTQECVEGVSNLADAGSSPALSWQQQTLTFTFSNHTDADGQRQPDFANHTALAAWLAGARLVELGFAHDQYFYVPVTMDSFLLPAKEPADEAMTQN